MDFGSVSFTISSPFRVTLLLLLIFGREIGKEEKRENRSRLVVNLSFTTHVTTSFGILSVEPPI